MMNFIILTGNSPTQNSTPVLKDMTTLDQRQCNNYLAKVRIVRKARYEAQRFSRYLHESMQHLYPHYAPITNLFLDHAKNRPRLPHITQTIYRLRYL